MNDGKTVVIDDLAIFLAADTSILSRVTHLYLANSNLNRVLDKKNKYAGFIKQLKRCKHLRNINLENNQLKELNVDLKLFLQAANTLLNLSVINLRDNQFSSDDLQLFEFKLRAKNPNLILIAPGCLSCPPNVVIPGQNWTLAPQRCEIELCEMIDVAQAKFKANPIYKKLFGYRCNKGAKVNICKPEEFLATNMPYSALHIDGQAFIIGKYATVPINIQEYNNMHAQPTTDSMNGPKRISLLIHRDSLTRRNVLQYSIVKVHSTVHNLETLLASIHVELKNLHRVNYPALHLYRRYQADGFGKLQGKSYLITEYAQGKDGFEIMQDRMIPKVCLARIGDPIVLDENVKKQGLVLAFGYLISLMQVHAHGLIHTDVKPENVLIDGTRVRTVDFGTSLQHGANLQVSKNSLTRYGTLSYSAPELTAPWPDKYSFKNDYYSCGIILRQTLYPVACGVILQSVMQSLFLSNPNERIYQVQRKNPEYYLGPHFKVGLHRNYPEIVCNSVYGLIEYDAAKRASLAQVYFNLAKIYPEIAQQIFDQELNILKGKIQCVFNTFPKSNAAVISVLPTFTEIFERKYNLAVSDTINGAFNNLFRLLTLDYYLSLFELCNGTVPDLSLKEFEFGVEQLFKKPDLNLCTHEGIYHPEPNLDNKLSFHRRFKRFILNMFAHAAKMLINENHEPDIMQIVNQLKMIQSELIDLWNSGADNVTVLEAAQNSIDQLVKMEACTPSVATLLIQKFDAMLTEARENIMQQRSPKLARLQI